MTEALRPPQARGILGSSQLVSSSPDDPHAYDSPARCLPALRRPRPTAQSLATCRGRVATPGPPHRTTATPGPALRRGAHTVAGLGLRDTARLLPCPGASPVTGTRAHARGCCRRFLARGQPAAQRTHGSPTPSLEAPLQRGPRLFQQQSPTHQPVTHLVPNPLTFPPVTLQGRISPSQTQRSQPQQSASSPAPLSPTCARSPAHA